MPGMTGPDLQQELTRRDQSIPIVVITAQRDEAVRPRLIADLLETAVKVGMARTENPSHTDDR